MSNNNKQQQFAIEAGGYIGHFINYGTFDSLSVMGLWISNQSSGVSRVTNYGIMGSIDTLVATTLLNNLGLMGGKNHHIQAENGSKISIQNYMLKITETASTFNNFSGLNNNTTNFSHLVINIGSGSSIAFKDGDSKIILDFDNGFELGKKYSINKVATNQSGNPALGVDFSRLIPRSDIYDLTQDGDSFIVTLKPHNSTIGNLYKSNIRTMNNFYTMSNAMIYSHKYSAKRNTNKRRVIRRVKKTANLFIDSSLRDSQSDSWQSTKESSESKWIASYSTNTRNDRVVDSSLRESQSDSWQSTLDSLESNESFAYKSDSGDYYANNATTNPTQTRRTITTNRTSLNPNNDKYYFILTPFVNHNLFFESGRYNLSGLEYGFLTTFSGKLSPSNALGAHFMMSYGSLGDSKDKDFSVTNLNLNIGLNYKFDMIWDMYLKARGDFFYFLNQVKTLTMPNAIKPNTLGFGVSVAYGKDFNFGSGGMLGVELGIDYKALQSNTISLQNSADRSVSETYQKSLYNLIYVDLGLNYAKYFNTNAGIWGLNAGLGIKGNVSANKLAKSQIRISALNQSVDMVLDNDKVLGYANLSGSYVLNAKDFNMEFSIAYYGNYGDRVISNGGGVEMRVVF